MDFNIKTQSYRTLTKRLTSLQDPLDRIADVLEALANATIMGGYIRPDPKRKWTQEEKQTEFTYNDPDEELMDELREAMGQRQEEEEE